MGFPLPPYSYQQERKRVLPSIDGKPGEPSDPDEARVWREEMDADRVLYDADPEYAESLGIVRRKPVPSSESVD